jgi:hypothetical protein
MPAETPALAPLNPEGIPEALREQRRWAPWRAVWREKRGKYDKVPCLPNGHGLSTAKPERWLSFDAAVRAAQARPDMFAGVGYVMTGPHGIVGIDLDRCVSAQGIAPWAADILASVGSYAEVSPSGNGLRVFALGDVPSDWMNHDQGIEVYAGHEPRFLTLTGQRLPTSPAGMSAPPAEVLAGLAARYARERTQPTADVISLQLPDVMDELALPDLASLGLPWQASEFLTEGTTRGDRSREVFAAAVELYRAGLSDAEVFSVLATNPHAFEVALDHRRQDPDRALLYIWVEHCQKAKGRASSRVASADDFDDVSEPGAGAAPGVKAMFDIVPAADFSIGKPLRWLLKRLLPHGTVGAVYGASGAGKSFLVLDMVIAIARGQDWRGHRCKQAGVLYVAAEGAAGVRNRLTAHSRHHGYELSSMPLFVLGGAPNITETAQVKGLVASIRARCTPDVRLIVMDTLAQVTPGANENSGEDMGRALAHCRVLAEATGAMVLLVAHAGKDTERGLRGWSGIKGALDVEIVVEREGAYRAARVTKLKDADEDGTEMPFSLHSVAIGEDEDGDPITSAVVDHKAEGKGKLPPKAKNQQLVLSVLTNIHDMAGAPTAPELIDAVAAQMPEDKAMNARRQRAKEAISALEAAGRIRFEGNRIFESA